MYNIYNVLLYIIIENISREGKNSIIYKYRRKGKEMKKCIYFV
jgi:hypothetical protein